MESLASEQTNINEETSPCCGGEAAPIQETSSCCGGSAVPVTEEFITNPVNTLAYSPARCINCEMCLMVCPHAVFASGENAVTLAYPQDCMECGACQLNCPVDAIIVDSGVGCAAAMIQAALLGKDEVTCGPDDSGASCCG
jgi:NAD-dependent dihydropyrimidine dehydrogenase PreA subunit